MKTENEKTSVWRFLVLFFVTDSAISIALSKTVRQTVDSFNFSKKYYG